MSKTLSYLYVLSLVFLVSGCAATTEGTPFSAPAQTNIDLNKPANATSQPTAVKPTSKSVSSTSKTGYLARTDVQDFASQTAQAKGIPLANVQGLLSQANRLPIAIRLMTPVEPGQPVQPKNWATYRAKFVEPIRVNSGKAFIKEHQRVLNQAEQQFGVPASIIAAIIGVETLYGQHMGNYRVLDAITTLSFDYPDPNRPDRVSMFQGQLSDLIELHHQGKIDATRQLGSYAGAMGIPQFMPTSLKTYAVSASPNAARIDLDRNVNDAIYSVANFLKVHGWVTGLPVFAPVDLPSDAADLVEGGLTPTLDWTELKKTGAKLAPNASIGAWSEYPLGVINLPLPNQDTVQYRTATPNFFALTQYNRSYFYASAVADLAQALAN